MFDTVYVSARRWLTVSSTGALFSLMLVKIIMLSFMWPYVFEVRFIGLLKKKRCFIAAIQVHCPAVHRLLYVDSQTLPL